MREYNTEILSVGTELLLGHITNTDTRDISEMLSRIGVNVRYQTVVGDNPERLAQCVSIAKARADVIITTGGLGPTCDDLTKQVLAESFGLRLVENAAEREGLYEYIRTGKNFTPNNFTRPCCRRAARCFTTAGAPLPAAPLRRRERSSSCCRDRPTSACPCSGNTASPI